MSDSTTPGTEEHLARATLVVDADPDRIWRVLTEPDLVARFLFGTRVESDWQVGSPVIYSGDWDGEAYEDRGTVLEANPPLLLVTSFYSPSSGKEEIPENFQRVTYRIQPIDGGCRVSVEQDNNDDAEAAEQSSASWLTILEGLRDVAMDTAV